MLERLLEQQPAICPALFFTEVRKNAKELWTLTEADLACAEDEARALKLLKVATLVMSEEKTPMLSVMPSCATALMSKQQTLHLRGTLKTPYPWILGRDT